MITINKVGNSIVGSYRDSKTSQDVQFGVTYSEEKFKAMQELAEAIDNAAEFKEALEICDKFAELTTEDLNEKMQTKCPDIYVAKTGKYYLKVGNVISSVELPKALVDRINDSLDKGIDVQPLIKFWIRFLRNPKLRSNKEVRASFSERVFNYINAKYTNYEMIKKLVTEKGVSEEVAREMATTYQVKITKEGLLNTFKVSREITQKYVLDEDGNKKLVDRYKGKATIDENTGVVTYEDLTPEFVEARLFEPAVQGKSGDAFYCEGTNGFKDAGHFIKVGCVHRLPDWSYVDTNDYRSCVKGLHVGGLDYIRGYQGGDTVTHNVFVDPAHIGAVPDDNTGAIRCIQYFVHSSFAGVNGSIYHSSEYAAKVDAQWATEKAEILKTYGELKDKQEAEDKAELDELNSL